MRSISPVPDPPAVAAPREAELAAALRRLTRLAALEERERALSERRALIELREAHLEQWLRLGERLGVSRRPVAEVRPVCPHPESDAYFAPGAYPNEDEWWAMQLGKQSQRLAV